MDQGWYEYRGQRWNSVERRRLKVRRAHKQVGFLELAIRWKPEKFNLNRDEDGWVNIKELVTIMKKKVDFMMPGEEVVRDATIIYPHLFELSEDRKYVRSKKFKRRFK